MSQMEGDRLLPPPPPSSMHRCKVCKKCFPCGRSLGGHMRSHVNMVIAADGDERPQSSYGLRENPKKTWRLSNSGCGDGDKCCRECGKEFLSWRALFGHMKCHSGRPHHASEEKEKIEKQPNCEVTPITVPRRRRRTKRMPVVASCSLSGSEYEHEDEDGAISLMMLSRDVGCWGGGGSSESSVKNSVVLEDGDFVLRGSELDEVRNGFKKMESHASDDHFISDDLDEFEKPKTYSSCADEFAESGEELRKGCPKKNDLNSLAGTEMGSDLEVVKHCSSSKMESLEADSAKLAADHVNGFHCDTPSPHGGEKRSRFECTACKKTFQSYQALGGHRASHKRMKNSPGSRSDANNGSMGNNASVDQIATDELADRGEVSEASLGSSSKKNKEHECLICGKVFSSGQALGGHKRCHQFADGGGSAAYHVVIQQQPLEIANVLDLNLPATVDRDSNSTNAGNAELKSWWVGGSLKHEALVGVISN